MQINLFAGILIVEAGKLFEISKQPFGIASLPLRTDTAKEKQDNNI